MSEGIKTYTPGYRFKCQKDITQGDIIELCNKEICKSLVYITK